LSPKIIYTCLFVLVTACNSQGKRNISASLLIDSAASITKKYTDTSHFEDAIKLLEQATKIDSNNVEAYRKKFFFQASLGKFSDASKTLTYLIKFKPDSAELYFQAGIFHELNNDTIDTKQYFSKAILFYKTTLDTMDKKNPYWFYNWKCSAVSMIMAGQGYIIHDFLKKNCKTAFDSSIFDIETLSKSKEDMLQIIRAKYSH
jgi:tetratricopeptide (TPR) repeat protein